LVGDIFCPLKPALKAGALYTSLYLPSEADDKVSLTEVRRTLSKEGLLVIDVFNREYLVLKYKGQNNLNKERDYPSFFLQQKRTVSENGDYLCDSWTIHDKADRRVRFFEHKVRLYGRDKL
jgi:hypothetical protein